MTDYRDTYKTKKQIHKAALELAQSKQSYGFEAPNETRSDWGEAAVMLGCPDFALGGNGIRVDIKDALANIAHFCDRAGIEPQEIFAAGLFAYAGDSEDGPPAKRSPEKYPIEED